MLKKYLAIAALLSVASCLGLCLSTPDVHAQGKDIAAKKDGQLGNKEFDKDKLPGKLEISVAVGSFFTMIAVIKYL
jgi:hypothetical protein